MSAELLAIFVVGLLGSVHCVGMCGGLISAFSLTGRAPRRVIPMAVASAGIPAVSSSGSAIAGMTAVASVSALSSNLRFSLAYNAGRIASYTLAGAIAGGVAHSLQTLGVLSSLQQVAYLLANLMLIALGLFLMDVWRGLTRVEAVGATLWRRLQPMSAGLLPADTTRKALGLGTLWGWLPCGMVYSVLLTAAMQGSAAEGAAVMFAFGLGTLPMLLGLLLLGGRLQPLLQRRAVRVTGGAIVLLFGVLGLLRGAHGVTPAWLHDICVSLSFVAPLAGAWA